MNCMLNECLRNSLWRNYLDTEALRRQFCEWTRQEQLKMLLPSVICNHYLPSNGFISIVLHELLLAWVSQITFNDFSGWAGVAGWWNWVPENSRLLFYQQHSITQLGKAWRSGSSIFQMQQQFPKWMLLYQLQLQLSGILEINKVKSYTSN